jgi:16S rRNA (guanine527-N7)-methyltransferase
LDPRQGATRGRTRVRSIESILESQPWDALGPHLLKAGVSPDEATGRLREYAKLLLEWNRNISNLVSKHDEERIVERHVAEAVEPAGWLKSCGAKRWVDFGSGGGFPGIPLALLGVGERWSLVESRRTKTLFLRKAVETLQLEGVEVRMARLEALEAEPELHGAFDGFTSRATMALGPTLVLAAQFVSPGGSAFLWKGSRREEEMSQNREWERFWAHEGLLGIGNGQTVVARFIRKADE